MDTKKPVYNVIGEINQPNRLADLRSFFAERKLADDLRNAICHDINTKNLVAYFGMVCNELAHSTNKTYNPSTEA